MKLIASFIVKFHTAIFLVFMALAVVCSFMALHVTVNTDMTKYLPPDMQMKQGSDIMTEEFGDATVIELMVKGPRSDNEKEAFAEDLEKFSHIDSVTFEAESPRFNNEGYTRYILTSNDNAYSQYVTHACNEAAGACSSRGYQYWIDTESLGSATNDLSIILVAAVAIAMIILFVLAASWLEPLLLLFTIGIAVIINLGTNIVFESVSDTTNACGAILQMALSMDYLIMLLNRYRKEHTNGTTPKQAMEQAIAGGLNAIASSSVTTIAGLLCLVLMSFTIGRDMGLVLAKGVFLSLICAFAIMPALVLWFDSLMKRTRKPSPHPKMRTLSKLSFRFRYVAVFIFVILIAAGLAFKGLANPAFITPSKNPDLATIQEKFPAEEQVAVVYRASSQSKSAALTEQIENMDGVIEANSYASSIAAKKTVDEIASDTEMNVSLLKLLLYYHFNEGKTKTIDRDNLVAYIRLQLAKDMEGLLDSKTEGKLDSLADLIESNLEARPHSVSEAIEEMSKHPSLRPEMLKLIYLAYSANADFDSSWRMSTEELLTLLNNRVLKDSLFDNVIDTKYRNDISNAYNTLIDAKSRLISEDYGRIIITVAFSADSTEMMSFCTQLRTLLKNKIGDSYWLVGKGPMVQEMEESFDSEFNRISWITVGAIFLIVLITFRNLAIPIVLVTLIQTAFNWDLVLSGVMGEPIYYVALIVVQSILMGATIDYGILYTTNYREARQSHDIRESVSMAYQNSIKTICMSGSILVFVCMILGFTAGGITGQICLVISEGAAAAVILVLLVLPGVLAALDKIVTRKNRRFSALQERINSAEG